MEEKDRGGRGRELLRGGRVRRPERDENLKKGGKFSPDARSREREGPQLLNMGESGKRTRSAD